MTMYNALGITSFGYNLHKLYTYLKHFETLCKGKKWGKYILT